MAIPVRRMLLFLAAALMALAMLAFAGAAGAIDDTDTTAADNPFPFAVGAGLNDAGERFTFSAHEGPNGPSGYAKIKFPPSETYPLGFRVQGHVTCFTVVAPNAVTFGIEIEKGSGSVPSGFEGFVFYVQDNGKHNSEAPDIMGTGFSETVPTECPPQQGATPVIEGDIRVHTAL